MSDIFVSYARADRERVEPLVQAIEAQGLDVWWDRDIAYGESYHRVIEQALKRAKCAIVVWSRNSVGSEWVTNEASEARKHGILVPLLLDDVDPPLEFRHLQSAKLFDWRGASDAPELHQLIAAVRGALQRYGVQPRAQVSGRGSSSAGKSWWQTPAGWAVGAAALLVATAFFLQVLRQLGVIGVPGASGPAVGTLSADRDNLRELAAAAKAPSGSPSRTTASSTGTINLLDVGEGAQIVAANESGWRDYIFGRDKPYCSVIATKGFVTFAFRDERRARFDRFGVFIEATSDYNVKTIELYASDQSDQGPFQKVGTFTVPNFRNGRQPFHEFTFEPVSARYVKLVAVDWQARAGGPNGNVCTMVLYGSLR